MKGYDVMENDKKRVTFKVNEALYYEYKKVLIDQRTTPTADFIKRMKEVVSASQKSKSEE